MPAKISPTTQTLLEDNVPPTVKIKYHTFLKKLRTRFDRTPPPLWAAVLERVFAYLKPGGLENLVFHCFM